MAKTFYIPEGTVFSEAPPPVVTLVLFSEADQRGRKLVRLLSRELGLDVREDAVGNLFARWPGTDAGLAPVATGSHLDAIPNAGRYDGVVGVLGALEAMLRRGFASEHVFAVAPIPKDAIANFTAETQASITRAIGEANPFLREEYHLVLLDTLVHELNAVRGLLGEPDRLDHVDLREGSLTALLRFGNLPVAIHWIDLPGIARYKMEFALYAPDRRVTLSFPSPFLRSEPTLLEIEGGEIGGPRSHVTSEITSFESGFKRELIAFHEEKFYQELLH